MSSQSATLSLRTASRWKDAAPSPADAVGNETSESSSSLISGDAAPSGASLPRPANSLRRAPAKIPPASACAVSFFTAATLTACPGFDLTGAYPHPATQEQRHT